MLSDSSVSASFSRSYHFAFVQSYGTLIAMSLIASVGFHNWLPLLSSLGMGLVRRERSGRILGRLDSVGSLASIAGMLTIVLFAEQLGLRMILAIGGVVIILGGMAVYQLPTDIGSDLRRTPRLMLKKRYWL